MTKLTPEQRKQLIGHMSHAYARVQLRLDGREVKFEARQTKPLTYELMPFIDGEFCYTWLLAERVLNHKADGEEITRDPPPNIEFARRVLRRRVRRQYSLVKLKQKNRLGKRLGLPPIEVSQNELHYWDLWHCPKALVRQLEREFDEIEVLEEETHAAV